MSQPFADWLRAQAAPLWEQIFAHPFLRDLAAGTLSRDRFAFFLEQDYYYLEAFGRALAIGLAKAPPPMRPSVAAGLAVPIERPHHRRLAERIGLSPDRLEAAVPGPTTLGYANFLLATACLGSFGELTAALLPCTWTYAEIGVRLAGRVADTVYREWAEFYLTSGYAERCRLRIAQMNDLGGAAGEAERRRMLEAFITASRYEYSFWQMGYQGEAWPAER
ncbi:MAG: thiaminase II [Armatimonadetes bacterium]|nr:thiaminase II [Armatimonadota bacterium]